MSAEVSFHEFATLRMGLCVIAPGYLLATFLKPDLKEQLHENGERYSRVDQRTGP